MTRQFEQNSILWLMLLAAAAFSISYFSPVDDSRADASGSLLSAQALVQTGSLRLDAYRPWIPVSYRFKEINHHYYYIYPLGTPLLSAPLVWAAGLSGDVYLPGSPADQALQNLISALTVAASALLLYALARASLDPLPAFLLAGVFTFGSAILSSMGTALWSANLAVVFSLASLILIAYEAEGRLASFHPLWLGLFLFLAYLCRPSAIVLAGLVFLYTALYRRRHLLKLGLTLAVLAALLAVYSFLELHQVLPPYYRSSDFALSWSFFTGLYGNLLSPSRGLLIFSPFLIVILAGAVVSFKSLSRNPLFQLAGLGFLAHLLMISAWRIWWGGQSYGPRLFTDGLPALALLGALIWKSLQSRLSPRALKVWGGAALCLTAVSIWINAYQGMFNPWTDRWNDGDAVTFTDWRYPQFLASPQMVGRRDTAYAVQHLPPRPLTQAIAADSPDVVFENWYDPESTPPETARWSMGSEASIYFSADPAQASTDQQYALKLRLGGFVYSKVKILLNGNEVGATPIRQETPETFVLRFPGQWIRAGGANRIQFALDLSNAEMGALNPALDSRLRGIEFINLSITP